MYRINGQTQLRNINSGLVLRQIIIIDENSHEVSSGYVLHDEVQVEGILERIIQTNDLKRNKRREKEGMREKRSLGGREEGEKFWNE
jgi:hypothetical protein